MNFITFTMDSLTFILIYASYQSMSTYQSMSRICFLPLIAYCTESTDADTEVNLTRESA